VSSYGPGFTDEKKHASTIFGNKCCFSGGNMCNNISVTLLLSFILQELLVIDITKHGTRHQNAE
jgi:hypothetical protein